MCSIDLLRIVLGIVPFPFNLHKLCVYGDSARFLAGQSGTALDVWKMFGVRRGPRTPVSGHGAADRQNDLKGEVKRRSWEGALRLTRVIDFFSLFVLAREVVQYQSNSSSWINRVRAISRVKVFQDVLFRRSFEKVHFESLRSTWTVAAGVGFSVECRHEPPCKSEVISSTAI